MEEPKHAPSIEDGKLMRTSVSAMQRADRCPRSYRYRYVEHIDEGPEKASLRIGKEAHARMAHYLRTGEDVLSPMERVGLSRGLIPPRGSLIGVELPLPETACALEVPLTGSVDAVCVTETGPTIIDWKFKSSIDAWAASTDDLVDENGPDGIQMLGYAVALKPILASNSPEGVFLKHVTFQTKGAPDAKPTTVFLEWAEAEKKWEVITSRIVPAMRQAAAAETPDDVPMNLSACDAFGGCPYKGKVCHPKQPLRDLIKAAKLKSDTKGSKKMSGLFDGLEDAGAADSISPPDAPASNPEIAAESAAGKEPPPIGVKKDEIVTAETDGLVEALEASIAQVKKPAGKKGKKEVAEKPKSGGLCLYFGCSPVNVATSTLHKYVEELDASLRKATQLNCPDIRTTTAQDFSFGKWRGYMAKLAVETPPPPGHYIITRGDERVEVVAEALIGLAEIVVLGRG